MMRSAAELLERLEESGARLRVVHTPREHLSVTAPSGLLDDATKAEIKRLETFLIGHLKRRACGLCDPSTCPVCGARIFYRQEHGDTDAERWGCARCFPEAARHAVTFYLTPPAKRPRRPLEATG